jgi:photosystem II stability/assembly factor-like uncharacterized protein
MRTLCALLAVFSVAPLTADDNVWTRLGPPNGAVSALAADPWTPGAVYAASAAGLFHSADQGATWNAVIPGPPCCLATLLPDPLNQGVLYGLTLDRQILKSTDAGADWSPTGAGLPTGADGRYAVSAFTIDPINPSTLYAGNALPGAGVFVSSDGAATWSAAGSGLPDAAVTALAADPQNPGTLYAGLQEGGIFKSADGGATWNAVNSGLPSDITLGYESVSLLAIAPDAVFAAGSLYGIYKTTDAGAHWEDVGFPFFAVLSLAIDPRTPGALYAGTTSGIYGSTDSGSTWQGLDVRQTSDPGGSFVVPALTIDLQSPGSVYAASTYGGILQSNDAGATWITVNSVLRTAYPAGRMVLKLDPQTPDTVFAGTDYGLFQSTDAGANWSGINGGLPSGGKITALEIDPQDPSSVYAMFEQTYVDPGDDCGVSCDGALFKSTNGGAYWGVPNIGVTGSRLYTSATALALDPQNPATIYTAGSYDVPAPKGSGVGLLKSANGGANWSLVNSGLPDPTVYQSVYYPTLLVAPSSSATVYAGSGRQGSMSGSAVFLSTSGGFSWRNAGLSGHSYVDVLAIDPQNPASVFARATDNLGFPGQSSSLFQTTDGGSTWNPVGGISANISAVVFDPQNSGTVYAATDGGVFRSHDGGATWGALNCGLASLTVSALAVNPQDSSVVYAGTADGVYSIHLARLLQ